MRRRSKEMEVTWASKMAQQVRMLAAKPKDLSSTLVPTEYRESTNFHRLSSDFYLVTLVIQLSVVNNSLKMYKANTGFREKFYSWRL